MTSSPSDMRSQGLDRRLARLERGQDHVERDRGALVDVVTQRVADRVEHRARAGADRWLADTARANWRLGIRDVERRPRHLLRHIEDRRWPVVMEPPRQRHTVLLVVDPLLSDRVSDAEHRAPENLPAEGAWVDHRADVGDGEVVEDVVLAGLDVDLDFGEPGNEGA